MTYIHPNDRVNALERALAAAVAQSEGVITALQLDEFDANELRLRAAREAGWKIDPFYLGTEA
ncbi:hypothetical protein [Stenotrophomonas maltophilia]|uniref:hypothetical protein n=1 Tax=Stenotrophomonas maltophilia TaxID=40324 RepID=UPI002E795629|nr:hypothetical protein [Stenotrophomonas maltophilia]